MSSSWHWKLYLVTCLGYFKTLLLFPHFLEELGLRTEGHPVKYRADTESSSTQYFLQYIEYIAERPPQKISNRKPCQNSCNSIYRVQTEKNVCFPHGEQQLHF